MLVGKVRKSGEHTGVESEQLELSSGQTPSAELVQENAPSPTVENNGTDDLERLRGPGELGAFEAVTGTELRYQRAWS